MPRCLAVVIYLVKTLIHHGRRFSDLVPADIHRPAFGALAAPFGTHNLELIQFRVLRALRRLAALQKYLHMRVQSGRDLVPAERRKRNRTARALPQDPKPEAEKPPRRPAYDPESLKMPTMEELEAEVRRQPVGRTIAKALMDLGLLDAFCTPEVSLALAEATEFLGGSLGKILHVRLEREKKFRVDRDRYPKTWDWDWRDRAPHRMRKVLGWLIGEDPPPDPPPLLAGA